MMVEAEDRHPLPSKHKAIAALLPYAIWQERDGRPEIFVTILRTARTSREHWFVWHHVGQFVGTLLSDASPDTIVLVSPYFSWLSLTDREGLVQRWVTAASATTYTEEVGQSVVDMLLQIACQDDLVSYIPINLWSWLTKQPSLPPVCRGRYLGTHGHIVEVVRALKDIRVLKSYLLLVWSEWGIPLFTGYERMCISIREDFGGIGMGHHRVDLIQRLDRVLGQLDRQLEHLTQHRPNLRENHLQRREDRYRKLRGVLLEVNTESISRTLHLTITPLWILIPSLDIHRVPHKIHVCIPSPMTIISRSTPFVLPLRRHPSNSFCLLILLLSSLSFTPHKAGFV